MKAGDVSIMSTKTSLIGNCGRKYVDGELTAALVAGNNYDWCNTKADLITYEVPSICGAHLVGYLSGVRHVAQQVVQEPRVPDAAPRLLA
ncbi:hypothetical protein CYMTET_28618 [Cymbomonas tetramitiformis]|uniref:Uncharacterized protein n=1 Tax=Cymbomonas tetramitiformis TaxID=36881 RepID=A0AAE0FML8_9CHLO|nr:hypothetical protein CYMTET_28618 [Cymbomonas tetramitiformis]